MFVLTVGSLAIPARQAEAAEKQVTLYVVTGYVLNDDAPYSADKEKYTFKYNSNGLLTKQVVEYNPSLIGTLSYSYKGKKLTKFTCQGDQRISVSYKNGKPSTAKDSLRGDVKHI